MEVVIAAYLAYHALIFEQQQRDFNHSCVYTLSTGQAFKLRFHSQQSFSDWPCHDARVCVCVYINIFGHIAICLLLASSVLL